MRPSCFSHNRLTAFSSPSLPSRILLLPRQMDLTHLTFSSSSYSSNPTLLALLFTLNTNQPIPPIGLGTFNIASSPSEITAAVLHAIQIGYRHIDTATYYGTEAAIGEALVRAFTAGIVKREEMFITTKLWCDDNDPTVVPSALQASLSALRLEYLDLYLMHWPLKLKKGSKFPPKEDDFLPLDVKGSWKAMEKCWHEGLTKAIGVSNFTVKKLSNLLEYAEVVPAVNQVELHPVWQQKHLRDFCSTKRIHVSAWSPLGAPGTRYGTNELVNHPVITGIANKLGKTSAQVILRWGIQVGVSMLPKSFNRHRIAENFSIFHWELPQDDMEALSKIEQRRTTMCKFFVNDTTSPYKTLEELWDGEL